MTTNPFTAKAKEKKANRWNEVKKKSKKLRCGMKVTITWKQDPAYSSTGTQSFTGKIVKSDGWLKLLNKEGVSWYGPESMLTKIRHHD